MVVHRELHHSDDAAELGDESAEDAGFVHPPQRRLRGVARGQDVEEQPVGFRVLAQAPVDAFQRLGDEPRRIRVDRQIGAVRDPEDADEIDRIPLERVRSDDVDAVVVDLEILRLGDHPGPAPPQPPEQAVEHRRRLGLALFERGADDRRQIADVLRHEKIVLHEAFHVGLAGAGRIADLAGDRPLHVEAETLLGPSGEKMQMTADRPEKFLAAAEQREFARREQPGSDQFVRVLHAIDVFCDPEERVEVAQAPLAFLDVGFDEIARRAGPLHPLLAFGELGCDEFRRGLRHDLLVEARLQGLEELLVARDETRLDQGRADRHVAARLLQALVDRARRMADFLLQVPEHVEQGFDDPFDGRRRLVRQEEQEIDVGARRQHAPPVPADRDDRRQRRFWRRRREPTGRHFERDAEQIVDLSAQRLGAGPSRSARFQRFARLGAPGDDRRLQPCDRRPAKFDGIRPVLLVKRGEILEKPRPVETLAGRGRRARAAFGGGSVGDRHVTGIFTLRSASASHPGDTKWFAVRIGCFAPGRIGR